LYKTLPIDIQIVLCALYKIIDLIIYKLRNLYTIRKLDQWHIEKKLESLKETSGKKDQKL
jgi:hypothetical protein